jgi:hypothetical protein
MTTLSESWFLPAKQMPPKDQQVLIELKDGVGQVCDVAVYAGKFPVEGGGTEDRWICADVRLDTRQIKRWAHIYPQPPADVLKPFTAALRECADKLWIARCDSRDDAFREAAERACTMATEALKYANR